MAQKRVEDHSPSVQKRDPASVVGIIVAYYCMLSHARFLREVGLKQVGVKGLFRGVEHSGVHSSFFKILKWVYFYYSNNSNIILIQLRLTNSGGSLGLNLLKPAV